MFQFVPNARLWAQKYSTWIFLAIAAGAAIQPWTPLLQYFLAPWLYSTIMVLLGVLGVFAVQLKQAGITPPETDAGSAVALTQVINDKWASAQKKD